MLDQREMLAPADAPGYFGDFGGRFVPEILIPPIEELTRAYDAARLDPLFQHELRELLSNYSGRPTPLYRASRLSAEAGGAIIYLKREDLSHTGSHKINNAIGQALLARRMGKRRVIAETGAGQHGVATATVCAMLGLQCVVYMGAEDMQRQYQNVVTMRLLGAEVREVSSGSRTLKDAVNEALRDWATNPGDTYYLLGSALGPDPYPRMVRDFQRVIGDEALHQIQLRHGGLPRAVVACVGGGSNAIGIFTAFIPHSDVELIGVEAGGIGSALSEHAARLSPHTGTPGVLHGSFTYVLQSATGQIASTHSISAGLDYPAVGPEHSHLHATGRARYTRVSDTEALDAYRLLARTEGIIPALESAHAIAYAVKIAKDYSPADALLVNLSGRGIKDIDTVSRLTPEPRQ